MAVRIRLKRVGRKNRPAYRIGVFDTRSPRDGKAIELLGHYDPQVEDKEKKFDLDEERVRYWLSVGAKPSETVASFLRTRGLIDRGGKGKTSK